MVRTGRTRGLVTILLLGLAPAILGAAGASGAGRGSDPISCTGPTSGVVNVHSETGFVVAKRSGDALTFRNETMTVSCGTVFTVDHVNIDLGSPQQGVVGFDLAGGAFAPGLTTNDPGGSGSPEIEFTVMNPGQFPTVDVLGTAGNDGFAFGQHRNPVTFVNEAQFNLDVLDDGDSPDVDVVVEDHPVSTVEVRTYEGADFMSGAGTGSLSAAFAGSANYGDGPGADTVFGGAGGDYIFADDDPDPGDAFRGGAGSDALDLGHRLEEIGISLNGKPDDGHACPGPACEGDRVAGDIEYFRGGAGSDRFVGTKGQQTFDAGFGNDVLIGGLGDDAMYGGPGADLFQGGKGFDTVQYGGPDGVSVSLDGKPNDGAPGETDDVKPDVEHVVGSSGDDHLVGNDKANQLDGGDGNDVLAGHGGNDAFDGPGFSFQTGSDVYVGGPDTDTVYLDTLQGDLRVSLDDVKNDIVVGQPGKGVDNVRSDVEVVVGGPGDDTLTGNARANRLVGGDGKDSVLGGGGDDVLLPGSGADAVQGGSGRDTASFADAGHAIVANLVQGSAAGDGPDVIAGVERLLGSPFADRLTGNDLPNLLTGGNGNDDLAGVAGNDRLVGGPGNDELAGGPGVDTCVQGPGSGPRSGCEH